MPGNTKSDKQITSAATYAVSKSHLKVSGHPQFRQPSRAAFLECVLVVDGDLQALSSQVQIDVLRNLSPNFRQRSICVRLKYEGLFNMVRVNFNAHCHWNSVPIADNQ